MSVAQRLGLGFGLLLVLLLLICGLAWQSLRQSDAAIRTIYEDRTVPMQRLADIRYLAARDRIILNDAAESPDPAVAKTRIAEFDINRAKAQAQWDAYLKSGLTPEEEPLAQRVQAAMQAFVKEGLAPAGEAMRREDIATAQRLLGGPVSALSPAAQESLNALMDLQVDMARKTYEAAKAGNRQQLLLILALGIASSVLAAATTLLVTRRITRQLGAEPHELAAAANRVASGDLTIQSAQRSAAAGSVMASMQAMRQTLNSLVHTVREGVDSVATASGEISQGNLDLSSRTEKAGRQPAAVRGLHGAAQQHHPEYGWQRQERPAPGAGRSPGGAPHGRGDGQRRRDPSAASSRPANRITDIIGVIDGIAFQTNILALNAAVEAARAGEQGRGFAVVASEVRMLAQRSAEAAKQIKQLIAESVERIDGGSVQISGVGQTIGEVVGHVEGVSALIAQIALEASEQSTGIAQIDGAIHQLDTTTQQNAALVEEAAAAAISLRQQADLLAEAVAAFKAEPALG